MEKTEKYYTPDNSEFHLGFTFEMKRQAFNEDVCKKYEAENVEWAEIEYGNPFIHLLGYNQSHMEKFTRVKYLDREDIISLGWDSGVFKSVHCFTLDRYRLFHFGKPNISIDVYLDDTMESQIFRGRIKNKSELKKLMVQLGIYKSVEKSTADENSTNL